MIEITATAHTGAGRQLRRDALACSRTICCELGPTIATKVIQQSQKTSVQSRKHDVTDGHLIIPVSCATRMKNSAYLKYSKIARFAIPQQESSHSGGIDRGSN